MERLDQVGIVSVSLYVLLDVGSLGRNRVSGRHFFGYIRLLLLFVNGLGVVPLLGLKSLGLAHTALPLQP